MWFKKKDEEDEDVAVVPETLEEKEEEKKEEKVILYIEVYPHEKPVVSINGFLTNPQVRGVQSAIELQNRTNKIKRIHKLEKETTK